MLGAENFELGTIVHYHDLIRYLGLNIRQIYRFSTSVYGDYMPYSVATIPMSRPRRRDTKALINSIER